MIFSFTGWIIILSLYIINVIVKWQDIHLTILHNDCVITDNLSGQDPMVRCSDQTTWCLDRYNIFHCAGIFQVTKAKGYHMERVPLGPFLEEYAIFGENMHYMPLPRLADSAV